MSPSLTIRASAFASLFDCAYMFEAIHILGMKNVVGRRAILGTAIHAGTAAFDSARLAGSTISADDAAGVMMDKLANPDSDFDPNKDSLSKREAEIIGITLTAKYCNEWAHKFNYVAVEMTTKPLLVDCGGGTTICLTGSLDRARIYKDGDSVGITDIKTGSRAVIEDKKTGLHKANIAGHGAQVGTYSLLYEHTTGQEVTADAEILGMSTSSSARIAAGTIKNAKQIITGTEDQPGLLEFAADMFRSGKFYPNSKSLLCNEKYCPRFNKCTFRER
ncbi:PD-(D/E)XK nuclease family protein [Nitrosomonas sp. Nm132]|uniref:PD-(D/E)XK nuclease family protein n=1 Tax=Nitrosomonas sp. Nm132 TaxID=1881053 RepID=UPI000885ECD1|nr:PD-(D/E)XK nuclease family protein [Nitrosomonas sp. Nm132]SDH25439.1 PD-(D/E)XK nuclease superfamily protein [Nitrosomonas sp. Nm132]